MILYLYKLQSDHHYTVNHNKKQEQEEKIAKAQKRIEKK